MPDLIIIGDDYSLRSLSFNGSSQYLKRTPGVGNVTSRLFTFHTFFKRGATGGTQYLFEGAYDIGASPYYTAITIASDRIALNTVQSNVSVGSCSTTGTFTDTTAWHALTVRVDTAQAAQADRVKIEVDSILQSTNFSTAMAQNTDCYFSANGVDSYIGTFHSIGSTYLNGLMDETYLLLGQSISQSNFVDANIAPKPFAGSFGGALDFYLNYEDPTSTGTLGADRSGQGHDWTLVNMTTGNSSTDHP